MVKVLNVNGVSVYGFSASEFKDVEDLDLLQFKIAILSGVSAYKFTEEDVHLAQPDLLGKWVVVANTDMIDNGILSDEEFACAIYGCDLTCKLVEDGDMPMADVITKIDPEMVRAYGKVVTTNAIKKLSLQYADETLDYMDTEDKREVVEELLKHHITPRLNAINGIL